MILDGFRQWLRTMWTGKRLPMAEPSCLWTGNDLDELRHLIETADPRDPKTLEQIAARLGRTDRGERKEKATAQNFRAQASCA